jgi:hypothetical protein
MSDSPLLSQKANPDRQFVEVRPLVPVEVVAVIDARRKLDGREASRTDKVNEILLAWAQQEVRAASLIMDYQARNPLTVDS